MYLCMNVTCKQTKFPWNIGQYNYSILFYSILFYSILSIEGILLLHTPRVCLQKRPYGIHASLELLFNMHYINFRFKSFFR